jgi:hypothetical protein
VPHFFSNNIKESFMRSLILLFVLFQWPVFSYSQYTWSVYGGVPNQNTEASVIDAGGNKWVAMYGGGLSKFKPDETYDNYNSGNSGMPENFATCVTLDNPGNKWIGTYSSGAVKYDGTTWTTYDTGDGLPSNQINCITVDGANNKWIGVGLSGVTKYDGSTFTTYNTINSSLPNDKVNCVTIDGSGNKWFGTYNGLAKFNGTTWTVYPVGITAADHQIYSVVFENPTTIWIGTGGGLWKFDGNSTWINYNTGNSGLPYDYVNCIAIDQSGTKWIGTTQGGMAEFDGVSSWTVYNTGNSDIPGQDVKDIDIDTDDNLWICTNGGFAFYGEIPLPGNDATLSALYVNGGLISGFDPATYYYYVELPYGTVTLPVTTATTNDPLASMVITDALSLTGYATVDVTAEDGITTSQYWIDFGVAASPSTDATLSDLKVGGVTVAGFSPAVYSYSVVLPYGTSVAPPVTATLNDTTASMIITNAPSVTGSATVVVTAQDGTTTLTYTVNFSVAPPGTDATLSDLIVDGITVTGFNPSTHNYFIELPYGTTIPPPITATLNDTNASMVITNAPALPGTGTVEVTAENGVTTLTYTIYFTVSTFVELLNEEILIFPNPSNGIFSLTCKNSASLAISDIAGKLIVQCNIIKGMNHIDISEFGNGLYLIKLSTDTECVYYKIAVL